MSLLALCPPPPESLHWSPPGSAWPQGTAPRAWEGDEHRGPKASAQTGPPTWLCLAPGLRSQSLGR